MKKYLVVSLGVLLALALAVSLVFTMLPQAADAAAGSNPGKHLGQLSDPIKVTGGYISGTTVGDPANPCRTYRGIPYAAPPVGDLRWKAPAPVVPWTGVLQCTTFPADPIQFSNWFMAFIPPPYPPQSEDCLNLNIVTPATRASQKLPVMVYFHGGGYTSNSNNEPWVAGRTQLPEQGVVCVFVNQRLGALGLLCHPLLNAESGEADSSGNYLFLDLIQSLKWVRANISAFGGDPNNVTIFGESGGGYKVSMLMASPLAKGLFQRAIVQSGSVTWAEGSPSTEEEMYAQGEQFFANLGVTTLAQARAKSPEEIVAAAEGMDWSHVIDGYVLEDTPTAVFEAGEQNAVPLIVSTCLGELQGWLLIPDYQIMLESQWALGVPSYAVVLDQVPTNWRVLGYTCCHATDLCYVFGDMSEESPMWTLILPYLGGHFGGPAVQLRDVDRTISRQMSSLWAQFAKTGNPSVKKLIKWPAWDPSSERYLYINDSLTIREDFSGVQPY